MKRWSFDKGCIPGVIAAFLGAFICGIIWSPFVGAVFLAGAFAGSIRIN